MRARRIVFTGPRRAEVEPLDVDPEGDGPAAVWIRTRYSLVSGGTEGAAFLNRTGDTHYPCAVGYGAVGEVIRAGSDFPAARPGQLVLTYSPHQDLARASGICVPLPADMDPAVAVFARLGSVALTAVWVAEAELGDSVAVIGLGLVGNLCAQLFALAGADVIGIDRSPHRLALAAAVGIADGILADNERQVREAVLARTAGQGVHTAVEAVGNPALVLAATSYTRKLGQVILLGSPRGALSSDLTPLLNRVHLWEHGCVTLKGAHEWRFPLLDRSRQDPSAKHSLEANTRLALRLLANGRLRASELRSHVAAPASAQAVYEGVCDHQEEYLGVVFDWD